MASGRLRALLLCGFLLPCALVGADPSTPLKAGVSPAAQGAPIKIDGRAALQKAAVLVQQGRLEGGERQARLALADPTTKAAAYSALKPDEPSYQYTLAAAKVGKRQFEAAQALLEPLVAKRPDDPQLQMRAGVGILYPGASRRGRRAFAGERPFAAGAAGVALLPRARCQGSG